MINLSDEETSNHVDSDVVFKSSTAATSPQGMIIFFHQLFVYIYENICLHFFSFAEGESIFDSMADLPPDDTTNRLTTEETEMVVSESAPAKLGSPQALADAGDLVSNSELDQELQDVIMDPSVEFAGKMKLSKLSVRQKYFIKNILLQNYFQSMIFRKSFMCIDTIFTKCFRTIKAVF